MFQRPGIKAHLQPFVTDDEVYLLGETDSTVLKGKMYTQVIPLLDGEHSIKDIRDALDGQVSLPGIFYVIGKLEEAGLVDDYVHDMPRNTAAFWHSLGLTIAEVTEKLAENTVRVIGISEISGENIMAHLTQLGVQFADYGVALTIVLTDDYDYAPLEVINTDALENQTAWLVVKPGGLQSWIGALFVPGETGCWQCLVQRLRENRTVEAQVRRKIKSHQVFTPQIGLDITAQTALQMAAVEAAKWLVTGKSRLVGKLLAINHQNLEVTEHHLTKRPQCHVCGHDWRSSQEAQPIILQSRKKQFTEAGGHRVTSSEAMVAKYKHHISSITGVVKTLERVEAVIPSPLINNYYTGPNVAIGNDTTMSIQEIVRSNSGGKGQTAAQAQASGIGEALERYSAVYQGYEPSRKATYAQLGADAIHPHACMGFSEYQYDNRETLNAQVHKAYYLVPERFDENLQISWSPMWSLVDECFRYVPMAYTYFWFPRETDSTFCYAHSNGLAAGNSLEEAILQGFFELIERDSIGLWWFNRVQRPQVDLASFNDPYFTQLQDVYRQFNREFWVLDCTVDFGIPVFAAISRRTDKPVEDIVYGFGAHFDAHAALLRALTEMNQTLPIAQPPYAPSDNGYWTTDPLTLQWLQTVTLASDSYLAPDIATPAKTAADYPRQWSDDLRDDVQHAANLMRQHGHDMLALDMTRPDIGLSVAKVIIPNLCHFWNRFGVPRLYAVPVKLGWRESPLAESDVNQLPVFF
jgi:bacteriocin biosynthesis cyclodehydratase domain-containing protein